MCDFRDPPKYILENGVKKKVSYQGMLDINDLRYQYPNKLIPGIYLIATTGSYYDYFDGHEFRFKSFGFNANISDKFEFIWT